MTVKLFQFLATNHSLCVTHIKLQEYISQEESSISFIIIVVVVVVVVVVNSSMLCVTINLQISLYTVQCLVKV